MKKILSLVIFLFSLALSVNVFGGYCPYIREEYKWAELGYKICYYNCADRDVTIITEHNKPCPLSINK